MSKDFFEMIVASVDSPIYVTDAEGIIRYANPAFEEVTGYRQADIVGQKTSIIRSGKMSDAYYQRLWNTLLSGSSWKEEIINKRKDGTEYVVLQYITPVFDPDRKTRYFAAVQYDVTREKELRDERDIFFDVSVDLFCILEKGGTFKQTNDAWREILGWDQEDLVGKPMVDFLHPDDRVRFLADDEDRIRRDTISSADYRLLTSGDRFNWISFRIAFHTGKELFYVSGRDVQERVEMENEIRVLSQTDALTGVYNRLKFNQEMEKELARSRRYQSSCSLVLFDIDHFKQVNDTFGHNTGDDVLRTLAGLVETVKRDTDVFCRWGGEEFVLLCPNTDDENIRSLAERIRRAVETHRFETVEHITISLGTDSFRPETDTSGSLMSRVDSALYEAKRRGRNRVVSADHDIAAG